MHLSKFWAIFSSPKVMMIKLIPGVHEQNRKEHHTAGNAADAPDSDIFTLR
jgi:hypothetical protein